MRALSTIRSKRSRLRPTFAVIAASLIAFVAGVGGALSLAGTAGAVPLTPIQDVSGTVANVISVLGPGIDAIPAGTTGAAANWAFTVNDNPSSPISTLWANGDQLIINVTPNGGQAAQDVTVGSYVEFSGTPVVLLTGGGASGATAPTFTVAVRTNPADNSNDIVAGLTDELVITFTNNPGPTGLSGFGFLITGIKYTIGAGTGGGAIDAFGSYKSLSLTTPIIIPPNAAVLDIEATANTPPVSLLPDSVNQAISPIVITELAPGIVGSDPIVGDPSIGSMGYICVIMTNSSGAPFGVGPPTFVGSPTITVGPSTSGGTAAVEGTVQVSNPPNAAGASALIAQVLEPSTTTPTVFTISNIHVNAPSVTSTGAPYVGPVTVHVFIDSNSTCSNGSQVLLPGSPVFDLNNNITIFTVGTAFGPTSNGAIFGSTSEQTAVAALEYQLPPAPGGNCLPNNNHPHPFPSDVGSTVVLTVDGNGNLDAETASYVAGFYDTGVLLTEGAFLDAENGSQRVNPYTMGAIQQEGDTTVLIVGGPNAVSPADMTELQNTPAYECGGSVLRTNLDGSVQHLQVQRVWGVNADATAEAAATYINSGNVGQVNLSGAFVPNFLTFTGYNQTLGGQSSGSNNLPLRTAIIATDVSSQDAAWASAMAYADHLPILVTPPGTLSSYAETGLLDLGIEQVIVVGGNLAVGTNVSAAIEAQGIPVLRLAGIDYSQTSVDIAEFELNTDFTSAGQPEGLGWAADQVPPSASNCGDLAGAPSNEPLGDQPFDCEVTVALVRGDDTADAMSSSVVTGQNLYPVLATESPTVLGQYLTAFFNAAGSPSGVDPIFNPLDPFVPYTGVSVETILPFGGPLALAATTIQAALTAISAGANPT